VKNKNNEERWHAVWFFGKGITIERVKWSESRGFYIGVKVYDFIMVDTHHICPIP
jgi:hypothetical protein